MTYCPLLLAKFPHKTVHIPKKFSDVLVLYYDSREVAQTNKCHFFGINERIHVTREPRRECLV